RSQARRAAAPGTGRDLPGRHGAFAPDDAPVRMDQPGAQRGLLRRRLRGQPALAARLGTTARGSPARTRAGAHSSTGSVATSRGSNMSRSYRISVEESISRVIRAEDKVQTQLEILEVLPPEQMAELLARELEQRGFQREGDTMVQELEDGVKVSVDLR